MSISPSLHDPAPRPPPAASTSNGGAQSGQPTLQSEVRRLTQAKEDIEAQLDVYISVLSTNKCTMQTPLIDPQGFPRSDIDVAGVRTARAQIIRLRNDLEAVRSEMGQLVERGLPREGGEGTPSGDGQAQIAGVQAPELADTEKPFARVDGVFPGSPADVAGIVRSDLLLSISNIDSANHDSLRAVGQLVAASEGVVVPLVILRTGDNGEQRRLSLRLTPRTGWGGRGLLGCHIVPV